MGRLVTTSGAHPFVVPVCPVCHGPKWQKHMEVCSGPSQRIAPPPARDEPCGCPDGMFHRPLCPLVTGRSVRGRGGEKEDA